MTWKIVNFGMSYIRFVCSCVRKCVFVVAVIWAVVSSLYHVYLGHPAVTWMAGTGRWPLNSGNLISSIWEVLLTFNYTKAGAWDNVTKYEGLKSFTKIPMKLHYPKMESSTWCWRPQLTHWGRDKMADISQTTFSHVFSSMKMFEFRLKFHWSLFLRVQLTKFQHCFR